MRKLAILLSVTILSCGPSETEIQNRIDQGVSEATSTAVESTTTSISSNTTIYKEIDLCVQYVKEISDVAGEFGITISAMGLQIDEWYKGNKTSRESKVVAGMLNTIKINSLTRLNAEVNNLIPDSINTLNYKKWVQRTENTNKAMELLIYGFENSEVDYISQGNSLLTVINKDFNLLPNIYNCEN